jgi:hypothetical protein
MPGRIQQRWFTNDLSPNWRARRAESFNDLFYHQLNQLRIAYQLQPIRFGLDESNFLRPVFTRNNYAYAMLERLEWNHWKSYEHQTILRFHFTLSLSVMETVEGLDNPKFREVQWAPLIISFPDGYPKNKPDLCLNDKLWPGESRLQWDQEAYICTLNNPKDWIVGGNNTMLNIVDSMVDWLAANHFGRGPNEED